MKRKSNGMVAVNEAKAVAHSYIENLSVQSLGQVDRKLCFELMECLLCRYPEAVIALGDDLIYRICEAIDAEKDPQCLMLTFHIVEVLGKLLPDPCGPLANVAEDVFDILGRYFPIHFTHPQDEGVDVKRDELSRGLMLAFASTRLFEPFAIPLLLEKLSSSLPLAKVEALRYLSHCSTRYGADRMTKHAEALWSSLKDAILNSVRPVLSLEEEQMGTSVSQENEIATEALTLLQKLVTFDDVFLDLIVGDEEIKLTVNSLTICENYAEQKLRAVGQILSASVKASTVACNKVFESFFTFLMNTLGLSGSYGESCPQEHLEIFGKPNLGALYLCTELLVACRYLVVGAEELSVDTVSENEAWCCLLQNFCCLLTEFFFSFLKASGDIDSQSVYVCAGVKSLQILATFPGSFLPVPRAIYENILTRLMSIITANSNQKFLWRTSLKALAEIGSFIEKRKESDKAHGFMGIVLEKLAFMISYDDTTTPLAFKLEAISEVGATGRDFMLAAAQVLEKAVFAKLSQTLVLGNVKSADSAIELLDCFSNKVLPWFGKIGGLDEVSFHFALNIWKQIIEGIDSGIRPENEVLLHAIMTSMKLTVANCSEESQSIIINKAFNVLSSSCSFPSEDSVCTIPTKLEALELGQRDEWIISLFASVIIAFRPLTHIPNVKAIMRIFMATLLNGHLPAAQALGSIMNKLPLKANAGENFTGLTLDEAVDITFSANEIGLGASINRQNKWQQIHAIAGLAWIGKGLIMRGHEKTKDVTMTLLSFLLLNDDAEVLSRKQGQLKDSSEKDALRVMSSAADAFHILMSDSEDCLSRRFHAVIRPLYKQRYFSTMMPILISSVMKTESSSIARSMLGRVFAHIVSDTPIVAVLSEAKKLMPMILDSLSTLSEDITNKNMVYSILLVLSGILTDKKGEEAVVDNARLIIDCLMGLVCYPHMMLVRETAIQCLVAISVLPHSRIYPMRTQVLRVVSNALDDPKRSVRQEAVRCRQAWASIASRTLRF